MLISSKRTVIRVMCIRLAAASSRMEWVSRGGERDGSITSWLAGSQSMEIESFWNFVLKDWEDQSLSLLKCVQFEIINSGKMSPSSCVFRLLEIKILALFLSFFASKMLLHADFREIGIFRMPTANTTKLSCSRLGIPRMLTRKFASTMNGPLSICCRDWRLPGRFLFFFCLWFLFSFQKYTLGEDFCRLYAFG